MAKFAWTIPDIELAFKNHLGDTTDTPIDAVVKGACRDANDDDILACAVSANARFLLSGDKDLLTLRTFQGITVISPAAFVGL